MLLFVRNIPELGTHRTDPAWIMHVISIVSKLDLNG